MERFEQFIKERIYLKNVSPATIEWYKDAFDSWRPYGSDPTQWVVNMREAGIQPVSCNFWICAMNAYWCWAGEKTRLPYLKDEQRLLLCPSRDDVLKIIKHRPARAWERRVHALACLILDCGLRASECLSLKKEDVDFDNLIIKTVGKGGKHRLVRFPLELRKVLWRYAQKPEAGPYLFGTKNKTKLSVRNFERDLGKLGKQLNITGVRFSPHTLRHTFAVNYLRAGGNVFYLKQIFGPSNL